MSNPYLSLRQLNVTYQGNGNYKVFTYIDASPPVIVDNYLYSTVRSFTGEILAREVLDGFNAGIDWGDGSLTVFTYDSIIEDKIDNTWKIYFKFIPKGEHTYKSGYIYSYTYHLYEYMRAPYYYIYNNHIKYNVNLTFNSLVIDLRFYLDSICGGKVRITDIDVTKPYTLISLSDGGSKVRLECINDIAYNHMSVSFDGEEIRTTSYNGSNMIITYDLPSNTTKGLHNLSIILTKTDNTTELYTQAINVYPLLIEFDPTMDLDNIYQGDIIKYIITDQTNISSVVWKRDTYMVGTGFSYNYQTINTTAPNENFKPSIRAIITFTDNTSITQYVPSCNLKALNIPLNADVINLGPKRFFVNGETVTFGVLDPSLVSSCEWRLGVTSLGIGNTYSKTYNLNEQTAGFTGIFTHSPCSAKMKFNAYKYPVEQKIPNVYMALQKEIISYEGYSQALPFTFRTVAADFVDTFPTWNFGDGKTAIGTSVSHIYSTGGTKIVSIIYIIDGITRTYERSVSVISPNIPTISVNFNADNTSGSSPLTVLFNSYVIVNDLSNLSYFWDFGDGATSTEANPIHTYTHDTGSITRTVSLTVYRGTITDTETKVDYITINGTPTPPPIDAATVTIDVQNLSACNIYINGLQQSGFNPCNVKLTPGVSYTLDARKTGYTSAPVTRTFTANETTTVYITLTPTPTPPTPPLKKIQFKPVVDLNTNGRTIEFTAPDSSTSALWDTGDGHSRIPGTTIQYIYSKYGTYFVTCYYEEE